MARSLGLHAECLDLAIPWSSPYCRSSISISAQYLNPAPMNVVNAAWPRSCHQSPEKPFAACSGRAMVADTSW